MALCVYCDVNVMCVFSVVGVLYFVCFFLFSVLCVCVLCMVFLCCVASVLRMCCACVVCCCCSLSVMTLVKQDHKMLLKTYII